MSRFGWLIVVALAVVVAALIAVLASISPGREVNAVAFLREALAQAAERSYIHSTSSGSVTMLNGEVHHSYTESMHDLRNGDLRWRQWYEGCTFPHARNTRLCSIEIVKHDNIQYQKVDTSAGPGEWEVLEPEWDFLEGLDENSQPGDIVASIIAAGDMVELVRETVDGVTYRRFLVTRRPGEDILKLIESGKWEPPQPPDGYPDNLTVEDYVNSLREIADTELFKEEFWIREDNRVIWRIHRLWEKNYPEERDLAGAPLPLRRSTIVEYASLNEPVEIRPPIE